MAEQKDVLIKPGLLNETSAEEAREKLERGEACLIECRYDMEYQESRIPGAFYVPLNRLRWDIHGVDHDEFCIVYCRSGRRSKAAAFLTRERNTQAVSLVGGIKGWPCDVDTTPIDLGGDSAAEA